MFQTLCFKHITSLDTLKVAYVHCLGVTEDKLINEFVKVNKKIVNFCKFCFSENPFR